MKRVPIGDSPLEHYSGLSREFQEEHSWVLSYICVVVMHHPM
jgi:hypothetical protein